ncbi:hypothetical protein ANO11243_000960 [Dothideomycetidae sp. 11243]|nr:hypothetical protein ANO11243_000960 [fungal sp. No.11243]
MPEIAEVARVVHYLKKHLVGRKIVNTLVQEDDIIYGKVGTSASAFKKAMDGKTILDARQQGKYFWLVADSPPHPVMHLGMTGWVKFSNDDSGAYKAPKKEESEWPPRFWKFVFQTESKGGEDCEIAFVDARRLGRIRLVDVPGDQLRNTTPLKENGPDPVIDKEVLTVEWLTNKMRSKKVPIKSLLLDQSNISGVGNWVADEVLYQARLHPEQYSNTFSDEQVQTLHDSLMDVCGTACRVLADSDQFPSTWLMKHRWNKGKKDGNVLPNGEKITHITVGNRTSAVVLSRQKKTGAVAEGAVKAEMEAEAEDVPKSNGPKGTKRKPVQEDAGVLKEDDRPKKSRSARVKLDTAKSLDKQPAVSQRKTTGKQKSKGVKSEPQESPTDVKERAADSGAEVDTARSTNPSQKKSASTKAKKDPALTAPAGTRRSGRLNR